MYCIECGKQIQDNVRFCIYCGSSQDETVEIGESSTSVKDTPTADVRESRPQRKSGKELKLIGLITLCVVLLALIILFFNDKPSGVRRNTVANSPSKESTKPHFRYGAAYTLDYTYEDDLRKRLGASAEEILRRDRNGFYSKYHAFVFNNSTELFEGNADRKSRRLSDAEAGTYTIDYVNKTVQLHLGTGSDKNTEELSFTTSADGSISTLTDLKDNTYRLHDVNYTCTRSQENSSQGSTGSRYGNNRTSDEQPFIITNEGGLMTYLAGRTYTGPNGIKINIRFGDIYVNERHAYFNLSYTIISPTVAIVKGESTTNPDGVVRLTLDTRRRCIADFGATYCE
jgi:hypothetical protein